MTAREALSRGALVAAGVAIALAAAEVAVRLFVPEPQIVFRDTIAPSDDPVLVYELRPGARSGEVSSAGLRDREFARPKPPGTWRLAVIGDSIPYGSGGPATAAFPRRLELLLDGARAPGAPRAEVLNLGVPGYNVTQIVRRLRVRGLAFEPDAILYGYTLNDPQAFSIEAEALRRLQEGVEDRLATGTAIGGWLGASRLQQLLRHRLAARASLADLRARMPDDPAYAAATRGSPDDYVRAIHGQGEAASRLAGGLDELAALAGERELPVLVAIFPLFGDEGPQPLADVHQRVAAAAAQRGFAVLDLGPVYAAASHALGVPLRRDFLHPDALGHRVAAAAIYSWMCREARLAPPGLDCSAAIPDATDAAIERAIAPVLRSATVTP
jgi:lysophospholipase L1-like esterase